MSIKEWPEGAQFYSSGFFRKRVGGDEYFYNSSNLWMYTIPRTLEFHKKYSDFEMNPDWVPPEESAVKSEPPSKYHFRNPGTEWLDFYDIWDAMRAGKPHQVGDSAIEHACKKLPVAGMRSGGKERLQDIKDARDSLSRAIAQIERAQQ